MLNGTPSGRFAHAVAVRVHIAGLVEERIGAVDVLVHTVVIVG